MAVQPYATLSALAALLLGSAANAAPQENVCPDRAGPVALGSVQWNGWGRGLDNTRYQPEPAIRASDVAKLALKWAYGYPSGTEFGQPTVVDERVFVTSSSGRIYSLDSKTGCTYWTYAAAAGSRTAVTIGELARARVAALPRKLKRTLAHLEVIKAPSAAFFGDDTGAVYALDAQKGTLLWKTQVDTHPSARIVGAQDGHIAGNIGMLLGEDGDRAAPDRFAGEAGAVGGRAGERGEQESGRDCAAVGRHSLDVDRRGARGQSHVGRNQIPQKHCVAETRLCGSKVSGSPSRLDS